MRQQSFKPASLFYKRPSKSARILYNGCGCLVILMILTAIALPSFLNKAYKATNSEAKQYVGSMNKGQQAKFAENGAWGTSVDALGLGIKTETSNYKYSIRSTKQAVFNYGISKHKKLPSYFGAVFLVAAKEIDPNAERNLITTVAILCETETRPLITFKPADKPAEPSYQNGEVICGKGTTNQFASPSKLFLIMEYPRKKNLQVMSVLSF
jgi:type IV pilus assembly protein PilA